VSLDAVQRNKNKKFSWQRYSRSTVTQSVKEDVTTQSVVTSSRRRLGVIFSLKQVQPVLVPTLCVGTFLLTLCVILLLPIISVACKDLFGRKYEKVLRRSKRAAPKLFLTRIKD